MVGFDVGVSTLVYNHFYYFRYTRQKKNLKKNGMNGTADHPHISRAVGAISVQVESPVGKSSPRDERASRTKWNSTPPSPRPPGQSRMQSECTPRRPPVRSRCRVRISCGLSGGSVVTTDGGGSGGGVW
jgi:hypothetical protein